MKFQRAFNLLGRAGESYNEWAIRMGFVPETLPMSTAPEVTLAAWETTQDRGTFYDMEHRWDEGYFAFYRRIEEEHQTEESVK